MNKRLLSLMASLLLCGAVSAQSHFEADTHAQDNNMPVVAQVVLDGQTVTTGGYELGAFVGTATEARGSAQIQSSLDNTYWIQVYYSSTDEATATVSFKLYDGEEEYTAETTLAINPEGAGTPSDPVEIEFATVQTMEQTTQYAQGWSWWSTPIEMNGVDGLTMVENSMGSDGFLIRSRSGLSVEYDPDWGWWGDDNLVITNEEMYEIKMNNAKTATVSGVIANPASHPITISSGWNWIGYPKNTQLPVDVAFSSLASEEEDIILTRNGGFSVYVTDYGFWGDVEYLIPGNGYKYKFYGTQAQTFTYPSNSRTSSNSQPNDEFVVNPEASSYQYLMNVIASVELNDSEVSSDGYEICALQDGEIRGRARVRYCEPLGHYIALLTIFSNESDQIEFQLKDTENRMVYLGKETIQFESELVLGNMNNPYPIHFGEVKSDDVQFATLFPNPTAKGRMVCADMTDFSSSNDVCLIEVFNSVGERVILDSSKSIPVKFTAPDEVGVYIVRLTSMENIITAN